MRRLLLTLALTCCGLAGGQRAAAAPPTVPAGFDAPVGYGDSIFPALGDAGLDVTHYDLTLSATPGTDAIRGRAVLNVTARRDLTQIGLDFAGPGVTGVKVNGQAARHAQAGEKLLIRLPSPVPAGTAFTVTVAYSGTPALHLDTSVGSPDSGLRLGWITQAGGSYVLSEPDGAHTFFPCNDVPADGASYSLHVDVPSGYVAVASGVQTAQQTRGGRVYTDFELGQPIPTYALTVHVGKLELVTQPGGVQPGVAVRNAFPAGTPASVRATFDQTPAMLGFLADWFGPYPYPVYGVALTEDPQIPALETATLSTFPSRQEAPTVALHELSHQWFGDSLRLGDWSDIWLNEGFATYAELLWAEGQGQPTAPIVSRWYARLSRDPGRGLAATRADQLFDSSSYDRGALTLHALRLKVGDAVFRQILKTYVARFSGQSVRTSDLLGVALELGGPAALDAVQPWLTGPELPPLP